jgi:hypothetical protein
MAGRHTKGGFFGFFLGLIWVCLNEKPVCFSLSKMLSPLFAIDG